MSDRIAFTCSACRVILRAPAHLVGRVGKCPSCGQKVVVPPQVPEEAGPMLVLDDGHIGQRPNHTLR